MTRQHTVHSAHRPGRRAGRRPIVRLLSPLRDFLDTETSGAVLLAGSTVAALVWANSPWSGSYDNFWSTEIVFRAGERAIALDLRHWINDGLMAIFFLVVGLEIRRELAIGHLASRRQATLPVIAAIGGMAVPALIYLGIAGSSEPRGWAVPMATDIALAIGVLAAVGSRVHPSTRAFLLGLAIVDDIVAIVVIAAFYSDGIAWGWLAGAIGALGLALAARQLGIEHQAAYVAAGAAAWLCLHEAGVHATLAGVAMGLLAPTTPRIPPEFVDIEELTDVSTPEAARTTTELARGSVSVVEWLQYILHPWTSYVVVPLFALANAGIEISVDGVRDAMGSPITWGIVVGLVVGKPLGIVAVSRLAVRAGLAVAPDASNHELAGAGAAAGIGFTVALFITELAFTDAADRTSAKLAILLASVLAAAFALVVLATSRRFTRRSHTSNT